MPELYHPTLRRLTDETRGQFEDADFSVIADEFEPWVKVGEYLGVIRKHIFKVVATTLVVICAAFVRDSRIPPQYTATATLLIKPSQPLLFEDGRIGPPVDYAASTPEDQTQYELLKSRSLAERVILQEGLSTPRSSLHAPTAAPGVTTSIRRTFDSWIQHVEAERHRIDGVPPRRPKNGKVSVSEVNAYLAGLHVAPVPETSLVRLSYTSLDPTVSARMANAHARAFIQRGIELNSQASEDAEKFLQGKLAELKEQVEESEIAVNKYRRDKGIIPGLISVNGQQDVLLERLNKLAADLQDSHLKSISLGTEIAMIKEGRSDALPEVLENGLIQNLKADVDKLRSEYAALAGQFKPDYPPMQQLQAKITGAQATIDIEIGNAVANIKEKYKLALEQEKALARELDTQKNFAMGLNDAGIRYLILQREAETNRQLYDAVLKRMKDLTVVGDVRASNVSVVDEAEPPLGPSAPDVSRDLRTAGIYGLILGIGLAFLLEYLDSTIQTPKEAEKYLRVPSLASIPDALQLGGKFNYGGDKHRLIAASESEKDARKTTGRGPGKELISASGRHSVLAESYRVLRSSLLLSRPGSHPKVTLFTSAFPREGKTTVCVNTGIVLAHTGAKVLVVDADLRLPRCHKLLSLQNHYGLSELLTGTADRDPIHTTATENLFLLSSGRIPPNPSELLGSIRMKELLQSFAETYDYVLVDSAPVMLVSDPLLLSTFADGVVLVLASGETPKHESRESLRRLRFVNAKVFGIVLNKVKNTRSGYYYSYDSHKYRSYHDYYTHAGADDPDEESGVIDIDRSAS